MGFNESGFVVRTYVSNSGKFGSVVLDVQAERGASKIDFVTFDCVNDLVDLKVGAQVTVEGRIGMQKLTNKAREDVKIDGYGKWVPQLIVTKVTVAGASRKPESPKDNPTTDDDIPF